MCVLTEVVKKTKYQTQKQQSSTYFRVNSTDAQKIASGQYTIYDFIDNAFSYSKTRKELAIRVLERLKTQPNSFSQLCSELNLKKSTLYLLLLSLNKSGLIQFEYGKRNQLISLSKNFSQTLEKSASWWATWVET